MGKIRDNYKKLRDSIKDDVTIVVATKTRSFNEITEVIEAGAEHIGENYVYPEAAQKYEELGDISIKLKWHLIGHLQSNKINKAIPIFDLIQTVDSIDKAKEIDKRVENAGKIYMPVLLEINSGKEKTKTGFLPVIKKIKEALIQMEDLKHIEIRGLMTMGPQEGNPADAKPYFTLTRKIFEKLKDVNTINSKMEILSMGMSNSYKVAIQEGANMIRIGSLIFGKRE
ncbi:YggS family pyridoxal phosphate-dependent enzyme [candidate division WOR-3 bacterium]|nr:YggS family pyridoxal phosphate-dependent enzyme [candidate division WOR-3 bacterium]